jgi:hypothetical protein
LSSFIIILENDNALRIISRNEIYTFIKPFITNMLTFYNDFFFSNPRAILSIKDYLKQMAFKTLLKAISHYYI